MLKTATDGYRNVIMSHHDFHVIYSDPFLSSAKLRNLRTPRQQMSQFFCEGFSAHNLRKSSFGICEGFCEGYEFH
jgi:hypothetical protein